MKLLKSSLIPKLAIPKLSLPKLEQATESSQFIDNMVPTPKPENVRFFAGRALVALGAAALVFLGQLFIVSHVQYESAQFKANETFRFELANGTASVGQVDSDGFLIEQGTPVAVLKIQKIDVNEIVLEGTSSAVTVDGPGHRLIDCVGRYRCRVFNDRGFCGTRNHRRNFIRIGHRDCDRFVRHVASGVRGPNRDTISVVAAKIGRRLEVWRGCESQHPSVHDETGDINSAAQTPSHRLIGGVSRNQRRVFNDQRGFRAGDLGWRHIPPFVGHRIGVDPSSRGTGG